MDGVQAECVIDWCVWCVCEYLCVCAWVYGVCWSERLYVYVHGVCWSECLYLTKSTCVCYTKAQQCLRFTRCTGVFAS